MPAFVKLSAAAIPLGSSSGVASVAVGVAVDSLVASFAALTLAVLYFDLLGRAAEAEAPGDIHQPD